MKVKVTVFLSCPPSEQDARSLERAALNLTNANNSVQVEESQDDKHHILAVMFTMKTAAQYKVVDEISREFKSETWNFEGYQDMSIQF
ncbi:MAG: hypothetical protein WBD47_12495 [Phormidesmis sp.]